MVFTVARERARRAAIVRRSTRATPANPAVILCPRPSVARAIERALASEGGAWALTLDWARLLDALERATGLEGREVAHEATRVAWVEAALEGLRDGDAALAAALSVDPSSVARALLRSVDLVRGAGWLGERSVIDEACASVDRAAIEVPVRAHLALIAAGVEAVERGMRESATLDHTARLARWLACESKAVPPQWREIIVEGVDILCPLERAVLEALIAAGVRVDVAPWVWGWRRAAARPADDPEAPSSALEALARFPLGEHAERDDDTVIECSARDPEDEADSVAEWVASLTAAERAGVAIAVAGAPGDGPRVLRALERNGVAGAWSGTVSATAVPLWSVVRAAVRLVWRGPDALDLATVLSSPGSGTWGADRDRIVARLRAARPARWADVRAAVIDCTDPEQHAFVVHGDRADERVFDAGRAAALEAQRKSVLSLVAEIEGESALRELSPELRVHRLRALLQSVLQRFANPMRIRASVHDARAAAWWVASATAIREATRAVLDGVERDPWVVASGDPTPFLLRVERMLPSLSDGVDERRADRVRVLSDGDVGDARPEVLVVLGFAQGRYPTGARALAWLGPTERAALARASVEGLRELPDEGLFAQLAARDAHRLLSSPTRKLVLVRPHRDSAGASLEPCSTRADVLDAFAPSVAEARERRALVHVRTALAPSSQTPGAMQRVVAARMGAALDAEALSMLEALAAKHPERASVFAARLAPSRDFSIASALAPVLDKPTYSPSDLELATKCAFAFATRAVLGLRWLPLASGPRWGPRALMGAAQRAVRALEASDGDVERAIDVAMDHDDARGAALETAGARRVLRSFVRRFGGQRKRWNASELPAPKPPADAPGAASEAERPSVELELGCEHPGAPKNIRVRADVARVEAVVDGGERRAVVVDLRMGRLADEQAGRVLGVGAASAVLPAVASKQYGVPVDAMATVSLQRAETRVIAREGTFGVEDRDASLTALAADAKRRFALVFDGIARGEEPVAPHDHARRAALEGAGIRSCEGCPSRLLCRFDLQGERA